MNEEGPIADQLLGDIKKDFQFLFDRGYVIYSAKTYSVALGAWEVIWRHQDFFVKLDAERGTLDVSFGSLYKGFIAIRALIYFLSNEKDFVGRSIFGGIKTEAKLLQKHIDKFESSFESEFPKSEEELKIAEERYYARVR